MENNQNQNNPSGIWQHIWVTLIMQAAEEFKQKNYMGSWQTLQLTYTQLPPECQIDCQKTYEKITTLNDKSKLITGYNVDNANERKYFFIHKEMPSLLLELFGKITGSLFIHNWINKNFNATPINRNKPHIGSEQK